MTTHLIDRHSKNNKEATCSRRSHFIRHAFGIKFLIEISPSNLISVYTLAHYAPHSTPPFSFGLSHALVLLLPRSLPLSFGPLSLSQTPPKIVVLVRNDFLSSDINTTVTDYDKLAPILASSELQSLVWWSFVFEEVCLLSAMNTDRGGSKVQHHLDQLVVRRFSLFSYLKTKEL